MMFEAKPVNSQRLGVVVMMTLDPRRRSAHFARQSCQATGLHGVVDGLTRLPLLRVIGSTSSLVLQLFLPPLGAPRPLSLVRNLLRPTSLVVRRDVGASAGLTLPKKAVGHSLVCIELRPLLLLAAPEAALEIRRARNRRPPPAWPWPSAWRQRSSAARGARASPR